MIENKEIDNIYVKKVKPINNHFNLPQFGATVLSYSKHLMNRVISTAEQNGIDIYYTDYTCGFGRVWDGKSSQMIVFHSIDSQK